MSKEEKKKSGVSIYGQSDFMIDADPIEEIFALNFRGFGKKNQYKIKQKRTTYKPIKRVD